MGFNSVYRCLVEIFPKVDSRLLRAVAIEHPKDAYQAVDVVLKEIIPYLSSWSNTLTNPTNDDKVESGEQMDLLRQQQLIEKPGKGPSSEPQLINGGAAKETDHTGGVIHADATPLAEEQMDLLSKQKASDKQEAGPSLEPQPVDGEAIKEMDHTGDYLHIDATPLVEELVELLSQQHVSDEPEERQSSQSQPQPQPQPIHGQAAKETDHTDGVLPADAAPLVEALNESEVSDFYDASDSNDQSCAHTENEEVILLGKTEENSVEVGMNQSVHSTSNNQKWICENTEGEYLSSLESAQENRIKIGPEVTSPGMGTSPIEELHVDVQANRQHEQVFPSRHFDCLRFDDFHGLLHGEGHETELFSDSTEVRNPVALVYTSSIKGHFPVAGGSSDVDFKQEYSASEMSDIEDEPRRDTQVTRSWEKIDLLEEIIEDAKNNKKTLFSAMERVINMMREVELQEKAAEQAKLEASRGGLDILIKVEEMKEMLARAKEANNMHAGEVYGEKAILATEVRELQSRLLSLSDERDKSLAILDEIHQALEGRLATAEELRKAAEKERCEKEESARSAFAEQEAIMEKIIQETKILEQEAEENSKLREFLRDRGHIVDILQGEISVICQDVRLLKEKFDDHVPLSKSVSSSQTSCILATSGSSVKSTASDLAAERSLASSGSSLGGVVAVLVPEEGEALKTPKKTSPSSSVQSVSPRSRVQKETARADKELLLDDGWDLFDPDAEFDI